MDRPTPFPIALDGITHVVIEPSAYLASDRFS